MHVQKIRTSSQTVRYLFTCPYCGYGKGFDRKKDGTQYFKENPHTCP